MPKARTLEQKIAMTGKNPGIENVGQPLQQKRGSGVWKVLKVFFGIIIGLNLLWILLALIAALALFLGFSFNSSYPSLTTMLDILALNQWDVKLSALMVIVLPLLGIGYICYKLLFWKRFTGRDAVISLLAFILWVGSGCYIGGVGLNMANKHERRAAVTETIVVETASDALHVKIPDEYIDVNRYEKTNLLYLKEGGNMSLIYIPHIVVREDSSLSTFKIEIEKTAFAQTRITAEQRAENFRPKYELTDSLLTVEPQVFDKQHPWNRQFYVVIIRYPANKKVILEDPLRELCGNADSEPWMVGININ
jgi:hypothetical protein